MQVLCISVCHTLGKSVTGAYLSGLNTFQVSARYYVHRGKLILRLEICTICDDADASECFFATNAASPAHQVLFSALSTPFYRFLENFREKHSVTRSSQHLTC